MEATIYETNTEMRNWGYILLGGSCVSFLVGSWSMLIAPFMNPTGNLILDFWRQDQHYKYLLVLLIPVTLYAIIINWWGLKIFRHS